MLHFWSHYNDLFDWFFSDFAMPQTVSSQVKPIAPKGNSRHQGNLIAKDSGRANPNPMRGTKRKMPVHPTLGYAIPPPIAPKVARRNARERNRVKQVNCGFEILQNQIPSAAKHKKMSKVDTLRHAVDYIRHLKQLLKDDCDDDISIKSEVSDDTKNKDLMSADTYAQTHLTNNSIMTSSPQQQQLVNHLMHPSHHSSVLMSPTSIAAEFSNPGQTVMPDSLTSHSGGATFDRINFYNAYNANMMSPLSDNLPPLQNLGTQSYGFPNQHLQASTSHMYKTSPPNSVESSPSVYSESSAFFPPTHMLEPAMVQQSYFYSDCLDPNSEEDELLDAIVKWQED